MKLMLNGATGGTNFGDYLFAEIFQNEVASLVGEENVYWYQSRYSMWIFIAGICITIEEGAAFQRSTRLFPYRAATFAARIMAFATI